MTEDRREALRDTLLANEDKVVSFFEGLSAGQLDAEVYSEGRAWSVHDVLAHIVGAERSLLALFRNVAGGGSGTTDEFDLDYYNRRVVEKSEELEIDALLATFRERRANTIAFLDKLDVTAFDNVGRHPTEGELPLADLIAIAYRHTHWHIGDVRDALDLSN